MAHGLVEGLDLASRLGFYFDYARGGLRLLASRTSVCWRMNLNLALPKILDGWTSRWNADEEGGEGAALFRRVCSQLEGVPIVGGCAVSLRVCSSWGGCAVRFCG